MRPKADPTALDFCVGPEFSPYRWTTPGFPRMILSLTWLYFSLSSYKALHKRRIIIIIIIIIITIIIIIIIILN